LNELCNFIPHGVEYSFVTKVVHCRYLSSESFKGVLIYPSRNNISLGAFLFSKFLIKILISTAVKFLSSAVLVCICDCSHTRRCSSSSLLFYSGEKCSRMCRSVSAVSFVFVPSCLLRLVKCVCRFSLPAGSLYTSFQGLSAGVKLQNASKKLNFSFFVVDAYWALPSKYSVSRSYLKISLFIVLWYFLLKAFNLLPVIVSSSAQLGISLYVVFFLDASCDIKDSLHAVVKSQ